MTDLSFSLYFIEAHQMLRWSVICVRHVLFFQITCGISFVMWRNASECRVLHCGGRRANMHSKELEIFVAGDGLLQATERHRNSAFPKV
jgi:hypothetical protein